MGRCSVECPPIWVCLASFLMVRLGWWVWGEDTEEAGTFLVPSRQGDVMAA